jgi:hypothetical protein
VGSKPGHIADDTKLNKAIASSALTFSTGTNGNSGNENENTSVANKISDPSSNSASIGNSNTNSVNQNVPETNKALPLLSEAQKEETRNEIQKLVFESTSNLSYSYGLIPGAGGGGYNNRSWQKSFHLKSTEVTVREYTLFLNDLIVKGKKDEYEKAKPKVEEVFGSNMSKEDKKFFENYFTSATYKNYPMVFITPEAAMLYCNWLQELIIENTQGKFQQIEVRLPYETEWERAATGGKKNAEYGTEKGKLPRRKLPDVNYKESQKNRFNFLNSDADEVEGTDEKKNEKENEALNYFTCNVRKYDPNGYGLYNMSGNVSEMVVDKKGRVMTKGGNWNSAKEFLKIKDPDFIEFPMGAEASPYIGFRPVINFK